MQFTSLQQLARRSLSLASALFLPPSTGASVGVPVDVRRLKCRLEAARELAAPGFMTLRAVRSGRHVVDFDWDFASPAAARLLCCDLPDLHGRHLIEVLAGRAGRDALFNQYRSVVALGAPRTLRQNVAVNGSIDVVRHGVVRLGDGVAVTLTNLSAIRRVQALRDEIVARASMTSERVFA